MAFTNKPTRATRAVYFRDEGLSSIGLRPYVVYGAGRDQGMTSTPTKAMLAAAAGTALQDQLRRAVLLPVCG